MSTNPSTLFSSSNNSLNNENNNTQNPKSLFSNQTRTNLNKNFNKISSHRQDFSDSQNFEINQELNTQKAYSSGKQPKDPQNFTSNQTLNPQDDQTLRDEGRAKENERNESKQSTSRNTYLSGQIHDYNNISIQSQLAGGSTGQSAPRAREERGVSFCDTFSSSKSSFRGDINSSISYLGEEGEDDSASSSSDAGISSHDDEFDRLNRIGAINEDDFDYKIKWFFDRIEQDAAKRFAGKSKLSTDISTNNNNSSFQGTHPMESDSHSTNEDSASHDESSTLLGKRKHNSVSSSDDSEIKIQESCCTNKRQKLSDQEVKTITQTNTTTTNTITEETNSFNSFFPQFDQDFDCTITKKRHAKIISSKPYWTPDLIRPQSSMPQPQFSTPQLAKPATIKKQQVCSKAQIFEKASLIAKKYRGECLSLQQEAYSICKGKNALKFKCLNSHTFYIPVETIESVEVMVVPTASKSVKDAAASPKIICGNFGNNEEWCYKCRKFYNTCKEVAAQHSIVVVDGLYGAKITLKCEKRGHQFKISYTKKLHTLSCSDCRKEEREEWKEQLRQEEQRKNEQNLQQQRELFEQARREMEGERHHQHHHQGQYYSSSSSSSQGFSSSCSFGGKQQQKSFDYYTALEEQINLQAQRLTIDWLKKNKGGNNNNCNNPTESEKVFIVYKFIQTPIEALTAGMKSMMRDQAIQYFRRLAKLLHPDKNQHPLAKEAFQKLSEAVQAVSGASGRAAC